jgi:hypothetical protein
MMGKIAWMAVLTAALAVVGMAGSGIAGAQETGKTGTRVSPGGTTCVFVMAGFDAACQSTGYPQISIVTPPTKGQVSLREGQGTTVQYSLSGKCVGAKVLGTGIYYTAGAGTDGPDSFTISAKLGSGETAERSFKLNISDQ